MSKLSPERLQASPQHFIHVDRKHFKLIHLFRPRTSIEFTQKTVYDVAIGGDDYETPPGAYLINTKAKCPDWRVPNSPWAIELGLVPGTIVDGCTDENPLKLRWMGITIPSEGVGVHGTASEESIGTKASHGCIRMLPEDVVQLFDEIPLGTIIYIK
jgi:lipoprotein-anchoring transpeptidase ErfK/SrfK